MSPEKQLAEAFLLGFMCSREGFNGDCAYEHCAPTKVSPYDGDEAQFKAWTDTSPAFVALREEALKRACFSATPDVAMAEELKACKTQGKAVCEALEISMLVLGLLESHPSDLINAKAIEAREKFERLLTRARVVFPK